MKQFVLNQKEKLMYECHPDLLAVMLVKSKIYIYATIFFALLAWFFLFVMTNNPVFMPIMVICVTVLLVCLLKFTYLLFIANQQQNKKKYIITDVRVMVVDKNNEILQEVFHTKIKTIQIHKLYGDTGSVYLNKKEEMTKNRVKKVIYTPSTIILEGVNLSKVNQILSNFQNKS